MQWRKGSSRAAARGAPPSSARARAFSPLPPASPLRAQLTRHILALTSADYGAREAALLELSRKREDYADLAPLLWHSYGTITALLQVRGLRGRVARARGARGAPPTASPPCLPQEIVAIYPYLSPAALTGAVSNRVCNALALLQCVASHGETRAKFLAAHIPLYLYPFLNTAARHKPFEYLRLTSLGVIGALVKVRAREAGAARRRRPDFAFFPPAGAALPTPPLFAPLPRRRSTTRRWCSSCCRRRLSRCACASWRRAAT